MLDLLFRRRSTRKFHNKEVTKEAINKIVTAALLSPSSKNNRPWEFVVVDKPELMEQLSKSKPHGSKFLSNAPIGIIVTGDPEKSDVWVEDCSIASILIQLEAEKLGLGSCWVQIRERNHSETETASEYIKKQFNIPANLEVLSVIGIGYKEKERNPLTEESLLWDKIHSNKF
jgi:nitroreductase